MLTGPFMDIRPICNDDDHRRALGEIEQLWGAAVGTPEGDRLDAFVTLVEAYEEHRWPFKSDRPYLRQWGFITTIAVVTTTF
jgi:HTH-type transcriptional regulator / antitoxin HigA